MNITEHSTE